MGRHPLSNWCVILALTIRVALGCLFVWSSLPKILLPHQFLGDVYAYRLAGPVLGMIVAMVLPWCELLTGICLLGGVFVSGALLTCMGLALMFLVAVSWALYQGLNISCGCFGASASVPIGSGTLIRIIAILVGSGFAYAIEMFSPRHASISWSGWQFWRRHRAIRSTDAASPEESTAPRLETCT
jgi:hypothetical protein